MKSITLLLFIFTTTAFADTALTTRLRKNDNYDQIYEKVTAKGSDPMISEASTKFQDAWAIQKKLEKDPNSRAKMYYQEDVDAKPCSSCPKYLDLVLEVNKIVEKTKDQDVQSANEKMVALTKLKFLYYTVKSTDVDNNVTCKTYNTMLPSERASFERGTLKLAAEEALALPDVSSVQFYEGAGKEVHYYYKGEGAEANNVVEVVIMPDGKAIMKYYKYDSGFNLPSMGDVPKEYIAASDEDNYIKFNPTIETENMVLPTDIGFGSIGTKHSVSDNLDLKNKTDFSFNKQETNVSLADKDGHKYVVVEGENITDGKKKVDAIVNYDFDLAKDSDLKLGTGVGNTTETISEKISDGVTNKQSVRLGLTDHNHEYINVKTFVDAEGVSSVSVGNKYKIGEGSIGADVEVTREGARSYKIDALDQGYLSAAGIRYTEDALGSRTYGVSTGVTMDKSLRLSTEYSRSDTVGQAVSLNLQKKVSENTSMVLSVGKSEKEGATLMYQFQSKF